MYRRHDADGLKNEILRIMKEALKIAVSNYSELSGMDKKEVAKACLSEGPIRESVMMLLFAQAEV